MSIFGRNLQGAGNRDPGLLVVPCRATSLDDQIQQKRGSIKEYFMIWFLPESPSRTFIRQDFLELRRQIMNIPGCSTPDNLPHNCEVLMDRKVAECTSVVPRYLWVTSL